jgi:preprotein translocase subunit SecA
LIDEARTPLIISGQSGKSTKLYEVCDILARQLERGEASGEVTKMSAIMGEEITETGDYVVNEKDKVVNLTEDGIKKVENSSRSTTWQIRRIWRSSTTLTWHFVHTV